MRQGKALYAGISSYSGANTEEAVRIFRELGTPLLIHQPSYSMLNRWVEEDLLDVLGREGVGAIVFSPLAQGMLTDKYLNGIPEDSRAARGRFLKRSFLTDETLANIRALNEIASKRGQIASPDGDRLGAARPARDLRADRGQERESAREQPGRSRQARLLG